MDQDENKELLAVLAYLAATGRGDLDEILTALKSLTGDSLDVANIKNHLHSAPGKEFQSLLQSYHKSLLLDANKFYKQNALNSIATDYYKKNLSGFPQKLPSGWTKEKRLKTVQFIALTSEDFYFLEGIKENIPNIKEMVKGKKNQFSKQLLESSYLWAGIKPEVLISRLWDFIDDDARNNLRELKQTIETWRRQMDDEAAEEVNNSDSLSGKCNHDSYLNAFENCEHWNDRTIDKVIYWPERDIIPIYKGLLADERTRERMEILLTMRFGSQSNWQSFFEDEWRQYQKEQSEIENTVYRRPEIFLLNWCKKYNFDDPQLLNCLTEICRERSKNIDRQEMLSRFGDSISKRERSIISGGKPLPADEIQKPEPVVLKLDKPPAKEEHRETTADSPVEALRRIGEVNRKKGPQKVLVDLSEQSASPVINEIRTSKSNDSEKSVIPQEVQRPVQKPAAPSIWEEHLKPFLSENWFMMAGVILLVVGCGILSYVTWDKHWLFRYTLMPALLALFTFSLAYLGRWIENTDKQFKVTATILRGASIQLLPANFMTIALLSSDETVNNKFLVVPLMSAIYLAVSWIGLKKICGAVNKNFGSILSNTIIALNILVILAPMATTFGLQEKQNLLIILGSGFYLGFAILAYSIFHFTQKLLNNDIVNEKSTLWFYGFSTTGTFLQIFGWVHSHIRHLPHEYTYAPMIVLAAALVLLVERKASQLMGRREKIGGESFIGYSFVILGVLLSFSNEYTRIICCLLAGAVWLIQASQKNTVKHYNICFMFFTAGIIFIGLTDIVPQKYIGFICFGSAILLEFTNRKCRSLKMFIMAKSCTGTQAAILLITVISAILSNLLLDLSEYTTAILLALSAVFFMYRAYKDDRLVWVHAAMFIAAIILPYIGCVDLNRGTLEGNTLIFGLSILSIIWILMVQYSGFNLLKNARSTVLYFYGIVAVTVMIIRVVLERGAPADPQWYMGFMDYTGPIIMAVVLVFATWYSRSLIPALMASIIVIILFPELKANFRSTFELVGFGSGLGSACSALGLILASFWIRNSNLIKNLDEGDKFLNKYSFPFRRYDHTLFTWPLMASAIFLLLKTGSFNLLRQILNDGVSVKGSAALLVGGISCWFLCIYYRKSKGYLAFHPGWFYVALGYFFLFKKTSPDSHWSWIVLLSLATVQILHLISQQCQKSYPWLKETIIDKASITLSFLSHPAGLLCMAAIILGDDKNNFTLLIIFLTVQFIWHALNWKVFIHAVHLYFLILVSLIDWSHLTASSLITPSLYMSSFVAVVYFCCEFKSEIYSRFKSLILPLGAMAGITACIAGLACLPVISEHLKITPALVCSVGAVLIIWSRFHKSKFLLLWSFIIFYGAIHTGNRTDLLNPLHLSTFALLLALTETIYHYLSKQNSVIIHGKNGIDFFKSVESAWLLAPAVAICAASEILHLTNEWRFSKIQILSSYLSTATLLVASLRLRVFSAFSAVTAVFTLANIHFINALLGTKLRELGLSSIHILCLGLVMTLNLSGLIKKFSTKAKIKIFISWSGVCLSCLILVLLLGNYFSHPDLNDVSFWRYLVSAALSLSAALYLRNAARHPVSDLKEHSDILERLYHFAISMTFWCAALTIPFMRNPYIAMASFGIPAIYLYIMAEIHSGKDDKESKIYMGSSAIIIALILFLYVFKVFAQTFFYPDSSVDVNYYHYNSPWLILYGFILFRSHKLGLPLHAPLYGGLAIITGMFFSMTAADKMSPFHNPVNAAWIAVISGHFWIFATQEKSPIRTFVEQISDLNEEKWLQLKNPWGHCLLAAVHIMTATAIFNSINEPLKIAPLILLLSTLSLHMGIIRRSFPYILLGVLELLGGLHADFFVESYLKAEKVIWVVLLLWTGCIIVYHFLKDKMNLSAIAKTCAGFVILSLVHVLYSHPASYTGMAAVIFITVLALLSPAEKLLNRDTEIITGILFLLVPSWLSYFFIFENFSDRFDYFNRDSFPVMSFTFLLTIVFVEALKYLKPESPHRIHELKGKMINHFLEWCCKESNHIFHIGLWLCSGLIIFTQFIFAGIPYISRDLAVIVLTCAGLTICWFRMGRKIDNYASYTMMYVSALAGFAAIRHQLLLQFNMWKVEYDIWLSILLTLGASAVKGWLESSSKKLKLPTLFILFAIPAGALVWAEHNNLGTDYTLAVIGLNSLVFIFLGKNDKQSPYNAAAVAGFAAFSIISLWSKLEIHNVLAYVLPSGIAVLILLQMFKDKITVSVRFKVRLTVMLIMLGSTAYYSIILEPRSAGFNLAMIICCIAAMTLGALFKIKIYLIVGFAGLITSLISIISRIVMDMNRGGRMAVLGTLILLIGGALVFGNLYYSTHKDKVRQKIAGLRKKLGVWD